jgi:isocitrate lyase
MKAMIEAGAAAVHFEDQLRPKRSAATSAARCWCRPRQFIRTLNAARLAADIAGVETI